MRNPSIVCAALCGALLAVPHAALAKLRVAASTNDLASIAASVGGDGVEVFSIARATADVHRVEVLPSYMVKVSKARLYLKVGLGLDQWADAIIAGSRNAKLVTVDCSRGIEPLEKPTGPVTAAMGDVHPDGNPHYWLDPRNGAVVARNIAEALVRLDPAQAAGYRSRAEAFAREAEAAYADGRGTAGKLASRTLLSYHSSWVYLAHAFDLELAGTVEPKPGIPPTAKHLSALVSITKSRGVRTLLQEPYFSGEAGKFLEREAGLHVVVVSPTCDAPTAGAYLAHIRSVLGLIADSAAEGP